MNTKKIISMFLIFVMMFSVSNMVVYAEDDVELALGEEIELFASKPSQPTISSASPSSTSSITVKWSAVSGATKYKVGIRKSGDENYTDYTTTNKSYTFSGLSAGTKYYFRLYAVNSAGTSARSETYMCYTKPKTPDAPTVERVSNSKLAVSWSKVTGATKYQVLRCITGGSYSVVKTTTSLSYTDSGLSEASKYYYKIVAVIADGNSSGSTIYSERSANGNKYTAFDRPSVSKGTINSGVNDYVSITMPSANVPSTDTYYYQVLRKAKGASSYSTVYTGKNVASQTFKDTNVSANNAYTYLMRIKRSDGTTILTSDPFSVGPTMTAPILKSTSASNLTVSWNLSCPETVTYEVYRRKSTESDYTNIATVTSSTTYVDTSVSVGTKYFYYIAAKGADDYRITKSGASSLTHQILPTSIKLSTSSLSLLTGEKGNLTATISPSNATSKSVTWTSSDTSVATVSGGTITALTKGKTTITATTSNGYKATCVVEVSQDVNTCEHQYGDWNVTQEATCTENGSRYRVCSVCEKTVTEEILATGHSFSGEKTVNVDATCIEDGKTYIVCDDCDVTTEPTVIPAIGHEYSEWTVELESTCTEEGKKTRSCVHCQEIDESIIDLISHNYEIIEEVEPTDGTDGYRIYKCSECEDGYTQTLLFPAYVSIEDSYYMGGQQVEIPVNILYNKGFTEFNLKVDFDKSLELASVKKGTIIEDFSEGFTSTIGANSAEIKFSYSEAISGDGILFYLVFNLPEVTTTIKTPIVITDLVSGEGLLNDYSEITYSLFNGDLEIGTSETNNEHPTIYVSSTKTLPNKEVEVVVSLENNTGFASLGIELEYDSEVMTLTNVQANSSVGATFTPASSYETNPYNMSWDSVSNNIYNGELATLTFAINDDATSSTYIITPSFYKGRNGNYVDGQDVNYDEDFNSINLAYVSGSIVIERGSTGDINGDGSISNPDATYLLRYLANWQNLNGLVKNSMDVNGDESINSKDGTILMRYLAGWEIELD